MWDIGTFFESVEPSAMLDAARNEALPKAPAAMAIFGYACRRHLRLQNTFEGKCTLSKRSIATGCHSATSMARAILKRPTLAARAAAPGLRLTLYVDDFCQETSGNSSAVMSSMLKGGAAFVAKIKKAKTSISPKSTLICNDLETGKLLVRALGRLGVRLQLSCEADHLGHERTTASNRTFASRNKRFAKAKKRANRAGQEDTEGQRIDQDWYHAPGKVW